MTNVAIVAFAPLRNRQGADLAAALSAVGVRVTLYQYGSRALCDGAAGYETISLTPAGLASIPPALARTPFLGSVRAAVLLCHILRQRPNVIVAINLTALRIVSLVCKLMKPRLIYYQLECITNGKQMRREKRLCDRFCDVIVAVEPNRADFLTSRLNRVIPTFVIPNTPRNNTVSRRAGKLRHYLQSTCGLSDCRKIVLYSGSYQTYSNLEQLVCQSQCWREPIVFVLMLTDAVPQRLRRSLALSNGRAVLVPPVDHSELYEWVSDADLGLLPYEDDTDPNVNYCSPQKLFDYLACGIPFVGSKRPLIEQIAAFANCGTCVDMKDSAQVAKAIDGMLADPRRLRQRSRDARMCYEVYFNYDRCAKPLIQEIVRC